MDLAKQQLTTTPNTVHRQNHPENPILQNSEATTLTVVFTRRPTATASFWQQFVLYAMNQS
jgi:hypothetical protein